MTRKEIATLKEMERKAWYNLMLYEYNNAPRTTIFEIVNEWTKTDIEYREYLYTWCALNDVLVSLGVDADFNEEAYELQSKYYHECKETEEPTEEPTEPETTEETTETTYHPEKLYRDTESGEVKTEDELATEFAELVEENPSEYEGVNFWQYLKNCTDKNGTLEKHGEYISYRIYTTPTNPTDKGEYVTRCPIYKQARGFCERCANRGKSYFIKGLTVTGNEVVLL